MNQPVPAIFRDKRLQEQFDQDGFVKLQLLDAVSVAQLNQIFRQYFPVPSQDFFSSSYENDFRLKKEISDAIGGLMLPHLEKVFTNYSWFGSAFLSKGNGARSEMPMHQDWTIVDESQYIALNIWTPLQETTENNGTLEVIKGSHKWHKTLRAPTLPFYFDGYQSHLKPFLTPVPALPGEAVVLNQAVIHYSKPNKTNEIRAAITTGIKTAGAPMIFHYWNKETPEQIEQFKMDDDFLNSFTEFHQSIFKRPTLGSSVGFKPFALTKPSPGEVNQLTGTEVKQAGDQSTSATKKTFTQKILKWIKK